MDDDELLDMMAADHLPATTSVPKGAPPSTTAHTGPTLPSGAPSAETSPMEPYPGEEIPAPEQDPHPDPDEDAEEYFPPCRSSADIEGDFMPVTVEGGERVYCRKAPIQNSRSAPPPRPKPGSLLAEPISKLLAQVEALSLERAMRESEAASNAHSRASPAGSS